MTNQPNARMPTAKMVSPMGTKPTGRLLEDEAAVGGTNSCRIDSPDHVGLALGV